MGDDAQSAADGRELPAPPTELETMYTTPVLGIRTTTSDISGNSMEMS
jgi:hypothetical protein